LLGWCADLPLVQWVRAEPPVWTLLLALAGAALVPAPPGAVWLDLLNVGRTLSAVVRTRARLRRGAAVVAPFLREEGLDALVIAHGDNDGAGGRWGLVAAYPPGMTRLSVPAEMGRQTRLCAAGRQWTWDSCALPSSTRKRVTLAGATTRPAYCA